MPALIQRQHMIGSSHGVTKSIPGVRVALKTVQQDERWMPWIPPLHVVELQPVDRDKFVLSEGSQTHRTLLSRSDRTSVRVRYAASILCAGGRCQGTCRKCTSRATRAILR